MANREDFRGISRKKVWAALAAVLAGLLAALPCFAFAAGDSGEAVTQLQTVLYAMGYMEQVPDGQYGQRTQAAAQRLLSYAQSQGLNIGEEDLAGAWASGQLKPITGPVSEGDVSEAVLLVQRRLRALGYLSDAADGRFGANTRRALLVFQQDQGLSLTGELEADTSAALFNAQTQAAQYPVLSKGMQNKRVLELQQRLWQLGFFSGDLDGQYGSQTVLGVKALQTYIQSSGRFDWPGILLGMDLNGVADPLVLATLYSDFPLPQAMAEGDSGQDVYRLQRRLSALGYLDQDADGGYGANTQAAVKAFQERAQLKANGNANQQTVELLFSSEAPEALKPYKLVVDLSEQKLYVYRWQQNAYSKLSYTMSCSTGPEVSAGSYQTLTRPDQQWRQVDGLGWVAYNFWLGGDLYSHSVPYDAKGGQVNTALLSALGSPSQGGGIRVSLENARLIYEKCPARTPVEIQD